MGQQAIPWGRDAQGTQVLAEWTRERMEEVAHEATKAIYREVPGYREHADLSLFAEVETHARQVVGVFVNSVRDRTEPHHRDFPWTARHAMRRVDLGIGLPDFLRAFRVGQITLWDDIMNGVDDHAVSHDAALLAVASVLRTIEVGSSVAAETYLEAQQYQLADDARLARDLLEDLLTGNPPTVQERQRALGEVGLSEDASLLVMVATLPDIGAQDRDLRLQIRSAMTGVKPGLIVSRHDEVVALLPVCARGEVGVVGGIRSAVASLAGSGVFARVGVSGVHQGYAAVPDAYDEARLARHSLTGPGLRVMSEMSTLDLLVHSQPGLSRMVPADVRAFIEEDLASGSVLIDTLSTFVAHDLNARETALHLNHHVNTVYYRLGRIAERTGRDVRCAEELIDLLLAVRLVRAEH